MVLLFLIFLILFAVNASFFKHKNESFTQPLQTLENPSGLQDENRKQKFSKWVGIANGVIFGINLLILFLILLYRYWLNDEDSAERFKHLAYLIFFVSSIAFFVILIIAAIEFSKLDKNSKKGKPAQFFTVTVVATLLFFIVTIYDWNTFSTSLRNIQLFAD